MDKERLVQLATAFAEEMQSSEELRAHVAEHQRRSQRVEALLIPDRIPTLTEDELRDLFFDADAFGFRRNKEREFNRRLEKVGLQGLRNALLELITRAERNLTPDDLKAVWEMGGLGTLLSTELLCYRFPDRYWTYSPNVTLPAFKLLGLDVKASLPWGQKGDAYVYLSLREPMDQVVAALQDAGLPEADYSVSDIFLWHLQSTKALTPEQLAEILRAGKRTAQTLVQTKLFLEQIAALLQKRVGEVEARVGMQIRSEKPQWNVQYLDVASFLLARELLPAKGSGRGHPLNLCVYLLPQQIWWGVYAWASQEAIGSLQDAFERLGLIEPHEQAAVDTGGMGVSKKVWSGGAYFGLGRVMTGDEVAAQPDLMSLAAAIADDLAGYHERITPHLDDLRRIISGREDAIDPPRIARPEEGKLSSLLRHSLTSHGLYFTDWQIATFYTALQTKGFVLLSGISGTGKTKLAQHFAALLPQPTVREPEIGDEAISITVQPYMLKYTRLIVPKRATRFFDPPPPGASEEVDVLFNGKREMCRFVHASYERTDYLSLLFRGNVRSWFIQTFEEGDTLLVEPQVNEEGTLAGFRLIHGDALQQASTIRPGAAGHNWLFVPVRPDWRDSKSLLGYYNPLTSTYEWTPFLQFLLRAERSYRARDGLAWFVILDEMNLAHVEYYFADLLSVLESGRDEEGRTREPLRFDYPDEAEGNLPPHELHLPPNLYVIGTVNVDETTRAFSPKVLDRAFTLELTEADFSAYPLVLEEDTPDPDEDSRQVLLDNFTFGGRFARIEKQAIADYVNAHPEVRARLRTLSDLLRPYELHFGYRVFDEIVSYLTAAHHNGLYDGLGGSGAALDAAALIKVLPKFHGSRGRLEAPLKTVLAWSVNPDAPPKEEVNRALAEVERSEDLAKALSQLSLDFQMKKTAHRVRRMLWQLYTTGFAAFG